MIQLSYDSIPLLLALLLGLALCIESILLARLRGRLRVRIGVGGTRGKSSVVRLIAAGLAAGGLRTAAKTTGSAARFIRPDGGEEALRRRGPPSILEQRATLSRAVRFGAEVLVCELMSVNPECLRVEAAGLLRLTHLALARLAVDHTAELGTSLEQCATALGPALPGRGEAWALPVESDPAGEILVRAAAKKACRLVWTETSSIEAAQTGRLPYLEFGENLSLALAVCRGLGVPDSMALAGMLKVMPDPGSLDLRRLQMGENAAAWIAINAFAANDPDSTERALAKVLERAGRPGRIIGLFNLRADRADRTRQWLEALAGGALGLDRLCLIGHPPAAAALARRLRRRGRETTTIRERTPASIMCKLASLEPAGGLLFGFGNISGIGLALAGLWKKEGLAFEP